MAITYSSLLGLDPVSKIESLLADMQSDGRVLELAQALGWDPSGAYPYPDDPGRNAANYLAALQGFLKMGDLERANGIGWNEGRRNQIFPRDPAALSRVDIRTICIWRFALRRTAFEHILEFVQGIYPDEPLVQHLGDSFENFYLRVLALKAHDAEFIRMFMALYEKRCLWKQSVRPRPGMMRYYDKTYKFVVEGAEADDGD